MRFLLLHHPIMVGSISLHPSCELRYREQHPAYAALDFWFMMVIAMPILYLAAVLIAVFRACPREGGG